MDELIPFILSAILIILGLFVTIMPKENTKKELRDSEEAVKKTRRSGIVIVGCGIVLLLVKLTI